MSITNDGEVRIGWWAKSRTIDASGPYHTHEGCRYVEDADSLEPVTSTDKDRYFLTECTVCHNLNTEDLEL